MHCGKLVHSLQTAHSFASRADRPTRASSPLCTRPPSALTRVLLRRDHNILWEIPSNHLCPTVPQKLNYIHFVADLISGVTDSAAMASKPAGAVGKRGIDIGTGASVIYPLLGVRCYDWHFLATGTCA